MAGHGHEEPQGKIKKEMFVRDVISRYPETLEVFKRYLGAFSLILPGTRVESIEFNCAMHDQSHLPLLNELNEMLRD